MRPMKTAIALMIAALSAAALPARADWELLRGNEQQRLSVDPKTIKARRGETAFKYLVDFREPQGEVGGKYRSIVVGAALRCKERRIALRTYEIYSGGTGNGILLAQPAPKKDEQRFNPVEKGSSDEDLYRRVCEKAPAKKK